METFRSIATAASQAIVGESNSQKKTEQQSGTEPVSGVKGSGTTEDPYDAGNNDGDSKLGGGPASNTHPHQQTEQTASQNDDDDDDVMGKSTSGTADTTNTHPSNPFQPESSIQRQMRKDAFGNRKDDIVGGPSQGPDDTARFSTPPVEPVQREDSAQTGLTSQGAAPSTLDAGRDHGLATGGVDGGQTAEADSTNPTSSTGGYSTFTASKLDPHLDAPLGGSKTAEDNSSSMLGSDTTTLTNPSGSYKSDDPTNLSGAGNDGTQGLQSGAANDGTQGGLLSGQSGSSTTGLTGRQNDTTPGNNLSQEHHGSSSYRLPGQSDTTLGPSGGIAQGGVPQGINMPDAVPRPEHQTDKTGVTSMHHNDPKLTAEPPSSANDASMAGVGHSRGAIGGFGTVEPSVMADPRSGQKPMQESQGGDRPGEAPSDENVQAIREKKEASERALRDEDLLGASGLAGPVGMRKQSEKGTGQEWVRSTGYAAEGGNFDAAAPGAGKEADRLMEIHGVERSTGPAHVDPDEKSGGGLATKLKEKLHLGHH